MESSTSSPEKIMREWFLDAARKWDSAENNKEMQKAIVSDLRRKINAYRELKSKNLSRYEEIADDLDRRADESAP